MTASIALAMWSGPRNLSTTMMRSFGSRADTRCSDEPFYAAYLDMTGVEHPMRSEILEHHERDPARVAESLLPPPGPVEGPVIHYQKHMAHHMVEGMPRGWMKRARHVFLVRHPARVIASYLKKTGTVSLEAIGFPIQVELFEEARTLTGEIPVVVDSDAILRDPPGLLERLCRAIDIPWDPAMLAWTPGPKPEDGAWAPHWYDAVWASSGFGPPPGELPEVPEEHREVFTAALEGYRGLVAHRLE
ncbi:MAG: HAD family hydrolase [Myxococcota bacterium]